MATAKKAAGTKAPSKKTAGKKAAKTKGGRAQDRALISGEQGYEVSYVARKTGSTIAEVKAALKEQGHSRVKVVKALTGGKK